MTKTVCENIAKKNTQLRNTKGQEEKKKKKKKKKEVPGGPVGKTWRFHDCGPRFDPRLGKLGN